MNMNFVYYHRPKDPSKYGNKQFGNVWQNFKMNPCTCLGSIWWQRISKEQNVYFCNLCHKSINILEIHEIIGSFT